MDAAEKGSTDAPVWARPDTFPAAPTGCGWVDGKGRRHPCATREELLGVIGADGDARVALVWVPERSHMLLPEELPGATAVVLDSRKRMATGDLLEAQDRLRWFGWLLGGLCAYMFYQAWRLAPDGMDASGKSAFGLRALRDSVSVGIALLMFLIFAFIPWYQARKRLRELTNWTADDIAALVPVLRFETWLHAQRAPVTKLMFGMIALVGLAQLLPGDSLRAAGLLKPEYLHGKVWRLFTAPFLHGNLIHFLLNMAALLYLGRRMEVFARWPHVPLVFLLAACIGGEASARFIALPSVGASGGLMGWLGFLLVFESLHGRLVPRRARRRLLAGVLLTALIGLVGYRLIDNAAHAGGLFAGMLYALIVFPKSASPNRPGSTLTDRIAGGLALVFLAGCAWLAIMKIIAA